MTPTTKQLTLSDGRIATVRKGTGRDALEAQKQMGTDSSKMVAILTCLCTKIDGQSVVFEDLLDLDVADFLQLQGACAELNFSQLGEQASV